MFNTSRSIDTVAASSKTFLSNLNGYHDGVCELFGFVQVVLKLVNLNLDSKPEKAYPCSILEILEEMSNGSATASLERKDFIYFILNILYLSRN